jgi:hypothetical protein
MIIIFCTRINILNTRHPGITNCGSPARKSEFFLPAIREAALLSDFDWHSFVSSIFSGLN